jgi:hypothetical protein
MLVTSRLSVASSLVAASDAGFVVPSVTTVASVSSCPQGLAGLVTIQARAIDGRQLHGEISRRIRD